MKHPGAPSGGVVRSEVAQAANQMDHELRSTRKMSATTQKPMPQSVDSATDNDLPDGWAGTRLGDCVEILDNLRVPVNSDEREKRKGSIPYYGATGQVGWIDDYLFDEELLLLGEDGAPFLDKSKPIAYIINGKSWVNNHAHVLRTIHGLTSNQLLKYTLDVFDFSDYVTGSTRLKLNQSAMRNIPIALPPFEEQKRIVAKVEELLTNVNAARDRLAKVPKILKCFRQSVLAAACSGRLTEEWRKRNPTTESVSKTVEAIRKRRESEAHSAAQKERLLQIYEKTEENDSSELPEGWGFVALNKLSASLDYGTSAKSQPSGKMPVLRMGNIQSGRIDWTDLVYTSDREEIRQYSLEPNTVLFNRTNSPELVGKTAIYRGERPAIFAGYLIRINHLPELDPQYLNCCLNTNYAREFCSHVKTDGVSQSNINAQKLGRFELPYCRLPEQHEIVRRVGALFKLADAIGKRVEAATKRADKLTHAILGKAFRGELVPTEADLARAEGRDYETAQQLLARIASLKPQPRKASRKPQADRNRFDGTLGIRQSVTMRTHNKESVLAAVAKMKSAEFSFDELREAVTGDYESLKEIVFELLQESDPTLTQRFDEDASEMKLVRRRK
jgi:type I restriction enzyme S subunit